MLKMSNTTEWTRTICTVRKFTHVMCQTVVRASSIKPAGLTICELITMKDLMNVKYAKNASLPIRIAMITKRDIPQIQTLRPLCQIWTQLMGHIILIKPTMRINFSGTRPACYKQPRKKPKIVWFQLRVRYKMLINMHFWVLILCKV